MATVKQSRAVLGAYFYRQVTCGAAEQWRIQQAQQQVDLVCKQVALYL